MRLWTDGLDGGFIRYCNKTTASTDLYSILRATFLSLSGPVIQFLYNSMKFDWEIGASGNTTRSDPILGKNSFADIFFFDKNVSCVSDNFQAGPRENQTKTNLRNIQENSNIQEIYLAEIFFFVVPFLLDFKKCLKAKQHKY